MNGQRNMADDYHGRTVILTPSKTNGLAWETCIWEPNRYKTKEYIRRGKITGKIIHYRKIGLSETIKVRVDPEYANLFSFADLSFSLKDVIVHDPIDDVLEGINLDL